MNQSVTSSKGRQWLSNLTPASTSFEASQGKLDEFVAEQSLPKIPVAEVIEVSIPSRENFHTESLHQQLQGIGRPAVSDLSELKIPKMNNIDPSGCNHEIVFVSIPKLGEEKALNEQLKNHAKSASQTNQNINQQPANQFEVLPKDAAAIASVAAAFATVAAGQVEQAQPNPQPNSQANPHAIEREPVSAIENSPSDDSTGAPKFAGGEVGILVEKIIDRFPLASPTVLLFVGGEPNPNVDETCAQVASALANCNVGNVLLIDSDVAGRQLTIAGGMNHQPGLSEAINRSEDWRSLIVSEGSASFSFLPVGVCPADRWNSDELLRKMTAEMKQEFQFICVSAGDAHTKQAQLWCDVCDGSYLVVSLKNSNETLAKSAVDELMLNGARVLGCVVADAH